MVRTDQVEDEVGVRSAGEDRFAPLDHPHREKFMPVSAGILGALAGFGSGPGVSLGEGGLRKGLGLEGEANLASPDQPALEATIDLSSVMDRGGEGEVVGDPRIEADRGREVLDPVPHVGAVG